MGMVCALMCLPQLAPAASPNASMPDGVCGDSQRMAEATEYGRRMVQQVLSAGMHWSGSNLNEYVNRLGHNLARAIGSRQAFTIFLVYDPDVNAQAFPGGYIVINSGVISLAESEAELASVMSHEIAHVNACHWRGPSWKSNLFELLVLVPAVAIAGPVGIAVASGVAVATPAARAGFDRSAEREADRLAVRYLGQAGYDPQAAVTMFERIEQQEEHGAAPRTGLLASHPQVAERRKELERLLPGLAPPQSLPHDDAEFRRMRQQVRAYDKVYARATGSFLPWSAPNPPEPSRRMQAKPSL